VADGPAAYRRAADGSVADGPAAEVVSRLGPQRWAELQRLLLSRAARWASEVAPGAVHLAYEPGEPRSHLPGIEVDAFIQNGAGTRGRLANAVVRALGGKSGPLLIAWPVLGCWRPEHAAGAIDDLAAGCDISIGPEFDRGFYLIALARPAAAVLGLPERTWRGADAMATVLGAAHAAGIEAGLLRAERGLRTVGDVRAALADPLLDAELRALLDSRH
jgi:glycosyltransferase A (GT-A) superfamily protein (DUF2064 family)